MNLGFISAWCVDASKMIYRMIWCAIHFGTCSAVLLSWISPTWTCPLSIALGSVTLAPRSFLIACAFRVYHVIKFQHLELALCSHAPDGDPTPLYELILNLAEFHLNDLKFHVLSTFNFS